MCGDELKKLLEKQVDKGTGLVVKVAKLKIKLQDGTWVKSCHIFHKVDW